MDDLSDLPWPDIYNFLTENGNELRCQVNGSVGILHVERSTVRGLETWIFTLETEIRRSNAIEVCKDHCKNMTPRTNGWVITKAEVR